MISVYRCVGKPACGMDGYRHIACSGSCGLLSVLLCQGVQREERESGVTSKIQVVLACPVWYDITDCDSYEII